MHPGKVINRHFGGSKEVSPCKEKIPHTPLRETNSLQETNQVNCSCLSRGRARVGRGVNPKRLVAAAVADAIKTFHGTTKAQADANGYCDERLWANTCWKVSVGAFLDAIDDCQANIATLPHPLPNADRPRYLQAYLKNRFWKGGAK